MMGNFQFGRQAPREEHKGLNFNGHGVSSSCKRRVHFQVGLETVYIWTGALVVMTKRTERSGYSRVYTPSSHKEFRIYTITTPA